AVAQIVPFFACGNWLRPENKEKYRAFFESDLESIEFCPKSASFVQNQGINREFCGFLSNVRSTKYLLLCAGFKKITGNYQGVSAISCLLRSSRLQPGTNRTLVRLPNR